MSRLKTRAEIATATATVQHAVANPGPFFRWEDAYAHLLRTHEATLEVLDCALEHKRETQRLAAAWDSVARHLHTHRLGLSLSERGYCLLEQDGTTLHCTPTIGALAAWCEQEDARTNRPRDYMAREWIA
jgi:hypothetical protein